MTEDRLNIPNKPLTGPEIASFRKAAKITRKQLGQIMGYSYQAVASIENENYPPGKRFITTFRHVLGRFERGELWESYRVFALAGTIKPDTYILRPAKPCACGCGSHLVPAVWNQKYLPTHSPRYPRSRS